MFAPSQEDPSKGEPPQLSLRGSMVELSGVEPLTS